MFNNVGAKIKKIAKIVCWIGIIGSVILGIIMIVQGNELNSQRTSYGGFYGDFSYTVTSNAGNGLKTSGWLTLLLGPLFSWLASLGIYALGQITMNSDITAETAVEIKELLEKERAAAEPEEPKQDEAEDQGGETAYAVKVSDYIERCSNCGTTQRKGRNVCFKCGARFIRNEAEEETEEEEDFFEPGEPEQEDISEPEVQVNESIPEAAEEEENIPESEVQEQQEESAPRSTELKEATAAVTRVFVTDVAQRTCPNCGTVQRAGRNKCFKCGAKFTEETKPQTNE